MLKSKDDIVKNWLPRYTGMPLEEFGQYILLTNFQSYVTNFAELTGTKVYGMEKSMQCATSEMRQSEILHRIRGHVAAHCRHSW